MQQSVCEEIPEGRLGFINENDAISFEKGMSIRKDHKNHFDNKEYKSKLTVGQMLRNWDAWKKSRR